ncbi:MAG: hypothetical protein IT341_01565 [Chloroflexi bacterium]|nr:hypothetical protein [Chloroflexota bacterium]
MQTARRLYLYLMSGVTLGVLLSGAARILRVGLDQVGRSAPVVGGDDFVRSQLALAGAMILVGLPTWAIHWWIIQRSVATGRPQAETERRSIVRALYLALLLAGLLTWMAPEAHSLLSRLTEWVLGARGASRLDVVGPIAILATGSVAFAYHARVRVRDRTLAELSGAAAWLPRLYRYGAAFGGAMVGLLGTVALIDLASQVLAAGDVVLQPATWWVTPLAEGIAAMTIGGAIWASHGRYSARLGREPSSQISGEAASRLRTTYWLALVASGVIAVIVFGGNAIAQLVAQALGASPILDDLPANAPLWLKVLEPAMSAVPFAATGWVAFETIRREAGASFDAARLASVDRLRAGVPALIGLAYAGFAASNLVAVGIEVIFERRPRLGAEPWSGQVADLLPVLLLGGVFWALGWAVLQHERHRHEVLAARSTVRRAYLLLVLASAILSGVSASAVIGYHLLNIALGGGIPTGVIGELSGPIGAVAVALLLAIYHGIWLRRDLQLTDGRLMAPPAGAEAHEPARATVTLVLSGPPEADLGATLDRLRAQLPAGVHLDRTAPSGSDAKIVAGTA